MSFKSSASITEGRHLKEQDNLRASTPCPNQAWEHAAPPVRPVDFLEMMKIKRGILAKEGMFMDEHFAIAF